jgi:hypothetical protein
MTNDLCDSRRPISIILLLLIYIIAPISIARANPQNISAAAKQRMQRLSEELRKAASGQRGYILELIKSFPDYEMENQDIFLWDPNRLIIGKEGNILISDTQARKVFIFNEDGSYLGAFGQKGKGPGEIMNPFCLYFTGSNILLSDTGNYNIQQYSKEGKYINSFRVFKAYVEIAGRSNDGYIYGAPLSNVPGRPLIDVLDQQGKLIKSIIEPRYKSTKTFQVANMIKFDISSSGDFYVAYVYFPLVCKYSATGKLINEWKIDDPVSRIIADNNERWINGDTAIPGMIPFAASIKASADGFSILRTVPITRISQYDFSGRHVKALFYLSKEEGFKALDFAFRDAGKKGGDEVAFILQVIPQGRALMVHQKPGREEIIN